MNVQRLEAVLSMDQPFKQSQPQASSGTSFGQMLKDAMSVVEHDQTAAAEAGKRLVSGQVQDVAEVMILSERASLSLGLAVQVRNKLLESYQEIMRMPL